MTEQQLVDWHVLYNQNEIVSKLTEQCLIEDDAIYNEEVLEWWLVTPSLARWLKEVNEVILKKFNCHWWGRTTSGQAIYVDSVISDIIRRFN